MVNSAALRLNNSFNLTFNATVTGGNAPLMETADGVFCAGVPTGKANTYTFEYNTILAHQLSETVKPTFWYLDDAGKLAKAIYEEGYSVKTYCQNMLSKLKNNGSKHLIRPSVCTLDANNRTTLLHSHIIGKDLSWELYYLYKTGNTERLAHLMDYLSKVSLNGAYAETYNRNGGQADVGNQEQTGWLLYEIARITGICPN